jgi:hypothetical protein
MNEKNGKALVPRPPSGVEKAVPGVKRILSGMVSDTLALAEQRAPAPTKFRIGDYEWCEPDYRQILIWAEATGLKPEAVVARLLDQQSVLEWQKEHLGDFWTYGEPLFADGRLLKVHLDLRLLRHRRLEWINGLQITDLQFIGASDATRLRDLGSLPLVRLVWLRCKEIGLTCLNLTGVPELEFLDCTVNRLEELQLHRVPKLITLWGGENELAELRFDQTPNLHFLDCWHNRLTRLDLSGLHRLGSAFCGENKLTELKLADLPNLRTLGCQANSLRELDLAEVPKLSSLGCFNNQISKLDLAGVPELDSLTCNRNQIAKLDLSQCNKLWHLDCDGNRLTWLDLYSLQELKYLNCADNSISELDLSSCPKLEEVDCSGNPISVLDIRGLKNLRVLNCSSHTKVLMDPEQESIVQDIEGQFQMGMSLLHGNDAEAAKFFRYAAKKGHSSAQAYLGWWYYHEIVVPEDYTESEKWFRKAAEKGDAHGQTGLGCCYREGHGVPRDEIEAYKWFKLAAEQGHKDAAKELASLTSMLSPGEQQEGDRRYQEFKSSH